MAADKLKYAIGNASSTTASASITASDTALPLTADTNFNAKSGEGMILVDEGESTEELAYSTGLSGSSLTVPLANRGLEGTSAAAHTATSSVKGIISALMWNDLIDSLVNAFLKTTGALDTSKVVDLTTAQVLTNKTLTAPVFRTLSGWVDANETWTYASASTFTISGDQTTKYTKGTRLKFTQTSVKYAVVVASSYGAPNTTITIAVNAEYTVANAAISANYLSYEVNPQGYPGWFSYTPTYAGFTGSVTTNVARYNIIGTMCSVDISYYGTSNAANMTHTNPATSVNTTHANFPCAIYDNSSWQAGAGVVNIRANSATVDVGKALTTIAAGAYAGFTTSNDKGVQTRYFFEI